MDRKLDSIDEIISRYRDVINDNEKSLEEYKDVTNKYGGRHAPGMDRGS